MGDGNVAVGGRYVLRDLLGIGGMGICYTALDRALERTVVVKMPRAELASAPDVCERFRTEALAAARVEHRNVVRMLDYGSEHGSPYIVMEHVTGSLLSTVIADHGPMALAPALDIMAQIVAGIAACHASGVLHGDVKCDNVVLQPSEEGAAIAKLIDFGLARLADRSMPDGFVSGTPEYIAPEVIAGRPPSFASDQYAAGVVLYELLAGVVPFEGETTAEVTRRHLHDPLVPLSARRPDLATCHGLDELLLRALAKHPEERFPDIRSFARAVRRVPRSEGARLARGSVQPPFTTESPTLVDAAAEERPRLAVGSSGRRSQTVAPFRASVRTAVAAGRCDAIASSYLELARALVDREQLVQAASSLEEGAELLALVDDAEHANARWQLELAVAAIYDGLTDTPRARTAARAAHDAAERAGSHLGMARAKKLFARLARARS